MACHSFPKGPTARRSGRGHDLQGFLFDYLTAAKLEHSDASSPLFRSVIRRTKQLTTNGMTPGDIGRMVKRRLRDAALPNRLSAHSFRAGTITDLLSQGVPLEDVQNLAGHADPRTTRLYDRRRRQVTRNIVERISIWRFRRFGPQHRPRRAEKSVAGLDLPCRVW